MGINTSSLLGPLIQRPIPLFQPINKTSNFQLVLSFTSLTQAFLVFSLSLALLYTYLAVQDSMTQLSSSVLLSSPLLFFPSTFLFFPSSFLSFPLLSSFPTSPLLSLTISFNMSENMDRFSFHFHSANSDLRNQNVTGSCMFLCVCVLHFILSEKTK